MSRLSPGGGLSPGGRFRDLSIKRKLALVLVLSTSVALLVACAGFVALDLVSFRIAMTRNLTVLAGIIGDNSTAALAFEDPASARETLAALAAEPHITEAAVYGKDGALFALWRRPGATGEALAEAPRAGHRFTARHLEVARPVRLEGETIGTVFIRSDLTEIGERLRHHAAVVALVLVGASLAAFALSSRLRRPIADPILRLAETARMVSVEKDYSVRAVRSGDDEVGLLTDAFNEMLGQIDAREAALRRAHAELERRVEERTRELQQEVAERTRAQEELRRTAEQLARSNRELQDFASVASHDLQEPLRKVVTIGDRLRARCGEALGEQGLDYLTRMQNAAGRMQTLIDDLLTFSRVTTRAQPFERVDLGRVALEVISDLEVRIEQTGGSVRVGPLPAIEADPTQMRQLIQNLLGNALKFHRPGVPPEVEVVAAVAAADAPGERERCELRVRDNGIGFDEKYLDRLFTVFQRLHGRGQYEGTGVGLAVCRKIAERHGGSITARAAPGAGATFVVTLPVHQSALRAGASDPALARP